MKEYGLRNPVTSHPCHCVSLKTDFENSYAIEFSESIAKFYPVNVHAPFDNLISTDLSHKMLQVAKLSCYGCDVHTSITILKKVTFQNESDTSVHLWVVWTRHLSDQSGG